MRVFPEFSGPMYKWKRIATMPGVPESLAKLQGDWRLGLATNATDSQEDEILLALERANLARFIKRIYCYRNLGFKKPAKEFFLAILDDLGISPDEAVMIGDDFKADITGALNAGLSAVWYNSIDNRTQEAEKLRTIHTFGELPKALHHLEIGSQ